MLRRSLPKLIVAAIVLFWLTMMGLLVRREFLVPYFDPGSRAGSPYPDIPTETWLGVYLPGDETVGYIQTQTHPELREDVRGTQIRVTSNIRLRLFGERTSLLVSGTGWVDQQGKLATFDFNVRSGQHLLRVTATVDEGMLNATIGTAGEEYPIQWPLSNELVLWSGLGPTSLNVPGLEPGQEFLLDTFDPVTLSMGRTRVKCIGQETLEICGAPVDTMILTLTASGVTSKAWADNSGEIVRAETPFGLVIQKALSQEVLTALTSDTTESLLNLAAVRPKGQTPFRGARRMVVRLGGLPPSVTPATDATQTLVEDGVYAIAVLPEPREDTLEVSPGREFLEGDPFIQVDHPKITELAGKLTADRDGSWDNAQDIYKWVFENIEKKAVVSVPSALEVLETMEGDCNEHTVLYTALARAAGVPARVAIGLVWSEELNGFYYHAWPEVFTGQWTWVDPTLGQPVADATHIKLFNGGIETWTRLMPYMGQITVEVLEIQ